MTTAVIIGASRGIGLELSRQTLARGDEVIAVCRNVSKGLVDFGGRIEAGIDVVADDAGALLADRLAGTQIDLLIHNAGILCDESLASLNFDSIREQFEVNAIGPLRMTAALRHLLSRGAKLGLVTSRMGSISDNTSGGRYGYRMSKAALNIAGASLAHDLRAQEVSVVLLHPGYVKTDMTGHCGDVSPQQAAAGILARIDALTQETSGRFWHANGQVLAW